MKKKLKTLKDLLKVCKHKNKSIIVIDGFAEWEVTSMVCNDCGNKL